MIALRAVVLLSMSLPLLVSARVVGAEILPWSTAPGVGPNEVVYTLDLGCTTGGIVCLVLDAYEDQQTAAVTGSGQVEVDVLAGTIRFLSDGVVDLQDGMGARPTYATVAVSDLAFEEIPFIGVPATEGGSVFALTDPIFDAGGPLLPGSYPISAVVSYSAIADIVGPVDAYFPALVLAPSDVTLTGTLQIFAIPPNGFSYQLRDLSASLFVSHPTTLLGEDVVVSVTADLTLNLRGLLAAPPPSIVPGLGAPGGALLAIALGLVGVRLGRRHSEERR